MNTKPKKIKVLLIHNYYNSRITGGEDVSVSRDIAALKDSSQVTLYYYSVSNDSLNLFNYLINSFFSFYHFFAVYTLIKKEKIHIVHIHNFFPLLSCSVFIAAKIAGAKIVLSLHNYRLWCLAATFSRKNKVNCLDCAVLGSTWSGVLARCYKQSYIRSFLIFLNFKGE